MAINIEGALNKQRLPYSKISFRIDVVAFCLGHILSHDEPFCLPEELYFFDPALKSYFIDLTGDQL